MTLLEILEAVQPDPLLRAHAHIFLDEERIGRERWGSILPREGQRVLINVVPMGGGEGGKNPLRVILTMAVVVVASVFGAGLGGAIFGKLGLATTGIAGKFATAIGTTLIGTGGLLLVNAIAPIRPPSGHEQEQDSPNYFIDRARNTAWPFAPVPVVLGKHRMVPALGAATYTEVPEKRQESYKEDLGDEQYLRMLVVWGYGPLKVRDLKIGETPITDFQGVHVETREGREGEPDLETYPKDVNEQALSIKLEQADRWSSRTTAADADEISIDLTLPQGLARLDDQGKRQTLSVAFDLQYKEVGSTEWKRPPFVETRSRPAPVPDPSVPDLYTFLDSGLWGGRATTDSSWETHTVTTSSVTLTSNRSTPARVGHSWHVPQRGQYEVRLRRTTLDRTSDREFDQLYWTALRSFTNEDPIAFGQPLARTAIVIRATDQLHGSVDQLNAVVSSPVLDWNGTAWVEAETSNPASLYRHVLQGPARANPVPDAQIDLEALQAWHEFCDTNGNEYNAVRDFQGSIYDALADIASVGRASPSYADGKWSIVVDDGQQTPVQHFTPRNSSDFSAERHFEAAPHALRIRFANREEGWRRDERIVYRDDYSEIATAASRALSFDSNPSANDTVQIGSTTYTFTPSLSLAGDVLIGSTAEASAANLIAAITAGQGDGTAYGTGTTAHASVTAALGETNTQVVITALSTGPDGNSITVSVEPSVAESRITGEGSLEGGSYGAENFFSLDVDQAQDVVRFVVRLVAFEQRHRLVNGFPQPTPLHHLLQQPQTTVTDRTRFLRDLVADDLGREHRFRVLTVPAGAQSLSNLCFPFADDCAILFLHLKCLLSACSEVSLTTPEYPSGLAFQVFTCGLVHFHLLLLGLVGLLPYAYLWARSLAEPLISFYGPLKGLDDLFFFVSRKGYSQLEASATASWVDQVQFAGFLLQQSWIQFTAAGAGLAILGCWFQWRRWTTGVSLALVWGFLNGGLLLTGVLAFDFELLQRSVMRVYPLVSYGVMALWIGLAVDGCTRLVTSRMRLHPEWVGGAVAAGLVSLVLASNFSYNDKREETWARDYAQTILSTLPQDAVLFTHGDNDTGPIGSLHHIEGVRPDVEVYNDQGLIFSNRLFPARSSRRQKDRAIESFVKRSDRPVCFVQKPTQQWGTRNFGLFHLIEAKAHDPRSKRLSPTSAFSIGVIGWSGDRISVILGSPNIEGCCWKAAAGS